MAESETTKLLGVVLEELAHLKILVLNGGKESPIVERVPLWSAAECDSECDVSDVPVPKRRRVTIGEMRVHPGVAAYFEANKGIDPEDFDGTIPPDYLTTPATVRVRKRYYHRPKLEWSEDQLPDMSRPALLTVARDLGMFDMCTQVSKNVLLRRETTDWVRKACIQVKAEGTLPDFGNASNIEAADRAVKKRSGGAKKTKPEKKVEKAEKAEKPKPPKSVKKATKAEKPKSPPKKKSVKKLPPKKSPKKVAKKKVAKKVTKKPAAKGKKKAAKKKGK